MSERGEEVRLAFVVSHPIQYLVHRYRYAASLPGVRVRVVFGSRQGAGPFFDDEFGRTVDWGFNLLEGYESVFTDGPDPAAGEQATTVGEALELFRPHGIWIHGYSHRCTRAAWRWGSRRRIPVFLAGDSNIRKEFRRGLAGRLFRLLFLRAAFARLAGVLTVGTANEAFYARFGVSSEKMIRLPFTADKCLFNGKREHREEARSAFRAAWKIPAESLVPLWCGKFVDWKYPDDFSRALAASPSGSWVPLLAGEGPLRKGAETALRESGSRAVLTGFLDACEVPGAYAAADFLAHTCRKESYGLVAVEAAAMGLPMIVPGSMGAIGPTDAARPGVNALVYPDGDIGLLAGAMTALAADPALREKMGLASRMVYEDLESQFRAGVEQLIGRLRQ